MSLYNQLKVFKVMLNQQPVIFLSNPGLPDWDQITPAMHLIAEYIKPEPEDRILLMGCVHGAAAIPLAQQVRQGVLWLTDPSIIALRCATETVFANRIENIKIAETFTLLPDYENTFNTIIIDLQKGRSLGRRWLVEAFQLLINGGKLFLVGSNDMGVQSLTRDGHALFGNSDVLAYKKGNRLVRFTKQRTNTLTWPAWASDDGIAPGSWSSFLMQENEKQYNIHSLPGVFSQHQLDAGTRLLLDHISQPNGPSILDVGCGTGIIGIVLAHRWRNSSSDLHIDMVDSSLLAVASSRKNIEVNSAFEAHAAAGDLLDGIPEPQYNLIVTNPPFHSGKEVNYAIGEALVQQSYAGLMPGGELILVSNRFIRYDQIMESLFGQARFLYQDKYFHVISAQKGSV